MPAWSGNRLLYFQADGSLMGVKFEGRNSRWHAEAPVKLLDSVYLSGSAATVTRPYDVSPDGKRFLVIKNAPGDSQSIRQLEVVLNWTEELKRLVR